jgi:small subunit ribosomal protein S1
MTTEHEPSRAPDEATTAATGTIDEIDGVTTIAEPREIETEQEAAADETSEPTADETGEPTAQTEDAAGDDMNGAVEDTSADFEITADSTVEQPEAAAEEPEAVDVPTEVEAVEEAPTEVESVYERGTLEETAATETPSIVETLEEPSAAVAEDASPDPVVVASRPPGPAAIVAPNVGDLPDEIADDFVAALEHTVLEFKEGDIVEGTVVTVDGDGAMLDIGYKSEGIIPTEELSIRNNVNPAEVVQLGERIEALVLNKEDEEGRLILSKKRAQYERAWDRIQQITNEGGTVQGPVIEVVKGGLIVDIGLRGFLPASLVELRRVRDLDPYVGQEIEAKVIELDRNRNNVVLSRRAYLEEEQAEQRQAFLDQLQVGEVRQGVVSSVVAFGAFVDLGGMDGLVHVSELSWQHVNHPGEVVKVGDEVTVKVLEVDLDRERISLSIKQTLEDPWVTFVRENSVGSVVEGVVTKTVPFGAFVSVGDGVEGLVHVSEIAVHRVESPELELSIGQRVQVKVTEMEEERRRVSLSIKQALPDWSERREPPATAAPAASRPERRPPARHEFEREPEEERPAVSVDASLEAILQELKERGIGRR